MSTINIGTSVDPFYRYKRPVSMVENRTGKTIITNLNDISKALCTKSSYILYFIQLEKSTSVTDKGEIKMILTKSMIEDFINKYIEKFVLCNICKYPELAIKQANKQLYFICNACGNTTEIPKNKFTKIIYKDFEKNV
jgi:translation initiation factor 5